MATFNGQSFTDRDVRMDGNNYENCIFRRCRIIFAGGQLPSLRANSFDTCTWVFEDAAKRALQYLTALSSWGMAKVVEQTFEAIRGGRRGGVLH